MAKEFAIDTPFKERAVKKFWSYFDNDKREPGGVGKGRKKKLQIIQLDYPKWSVYYERFGQEAHSFSFSAAERGFLYKYLDYWFDLDTY
jgi:hypothetical protein